MDIYSFGLLLGGAGLGAMAVGGLAGGIRGHAGHAHTGHAHTGHAHPGHAGHVPAAHGHAGHAGHAPAGQARDGSAPAGHGQSIGDVVSSAPSASRFLLSVVSPRIVFSALVGFGATGMLLGSVLGGIFLLGAAVAGGIAFERMLVAPLWRFLFRFESGPAVTLESCITDEARAVTGFDAAGQGLIALELDGQVVQLLGTLTPGEQSAGLRIHAGDRVRIESVDDSRNRCTVSYLGV
jgi:hypothetical protein